jgi:hypothetical protein
MSAGSKTCALQGGEARAIWHRVSVQAGRGQQDASKEADWGSPRLRGSHLATIASTIANHSRSLECR